MNTRLDTIRSLAETDPYWSAYLAGMRDEHAIGRDDDRTAELAEALRLALAKIARLEQPSREDWDSEWKRTPTSGDCLRAYEATTAGRLEQIQDRINSALSHPEVRDALQSRLDR